MQTSMALCFIEPELLAGIGIFDIFLLLWPWPWPHDLHIWTWPIFPGDNGMCKYELLTSMLSKVII